MLGENTCAVDLSNETKRSRERGGWCWWATMQSESELSHSMVPKVRFHRLRPNGLR